MTRSTVAGTRAGAEPQSIWVAADAVVLGTSKDTGTSVLLVKRRYPPSDGMWVIPGGFVETDEALDAAARRELREETGVEIARWKQVGAFGEPGRDPRHRVVSVAYVAVVPRESVSPQAADDAADARWFSLSALPALGFDHRDILDAALAHVRERAGEFPALAGQLAADGFARQQGDPSP